MSIWLVDKKKYAKIIQNENTDIMEIRILYDDIMLILHKECIFPKELEILINEYVVDLVTVNYKVRKNNSVKTPSSGNIEKMKNSVKTIIDFDITGRIVFEDFHVTYNISVLTHKNTLNFFVVTQNRILSFLEESTVDLKDRVKISGHDHIQFFNHIKGVNKYLRDDTFRVCYTYSYKNGIHIAHSNNVYVARKILNELHCTLCIDMIKKINDLTIKHLKQKRRKN